MIDSAILLGELKAVVTKLETDILNRCRENDAVDAPLRLEFEAAKQNNRTAVAYEVWRGEFITQAAVAWVLATVFVRFIEDNGLLDGRDEKRAWISGAKEEGEGRNHRLQIAQDTHLQYFRENPSNTDREYLQWVFRTVCNPTGDRPIRALEGLFDERHNPLWRVGVSGDGATLLLNFWQKVNPETGQVVHDFTDPKLDTRFLGDLYQDLSLEAQKKYALLQTPIFVEEFILDRTLTPAIAEFGLDEVRLIDPTCGSGHFLLGAFERLFQRHQKDKPAVEPRKLAQTALEQVYGVDLNPFATAIARFRLLIAALKASEIKRLQDAPDFRFNLATGDSLLHGKRFDNTIRGTQRDLYDDKLQHHYEIEDTDGLKQILGQQYQAVVGNPPYIIVKDRALNQAYRDRFDSCRGKYSLSVPFMERFFDLTLRSQKYEKGEDNSKNQPAGFTGMITSNSFMKREFGKKLIEEFIPRWDLTTIIDASGAYIPGHGTPTVIMFGRHRNPVSETIRTIMGIKGEPTTPLIPSNGKVWTSITQLTDIVDSQNEFISVADLPKENFYKHPWNIGGGGASELKDLIETNSESNLMQLIDTIGVMAVAGEDEVYISDDSEAWKRLKISNDSLKELVIGEIIRDWSINEPFTCIFPYDNSGKFIEAETAETHFWNFRTILKTGIYFGKTKEERGMDWREYGVVVKDKFNNPISICFASVATHNHFAIDRSNRVFKQSAPVIKLAPDANEDDYFALLGILNSSVACFWMKQVFYPKGSVTGDISKEKGKPEANRYDFASTGLQNFPIPTKELSKLDRVIAISRMIVDLSQQLMLLESADFISEMLKNPKLDYLVLLSGLVERHKKIKNRMVALQEELDWEVYKQYGLTNLASKSEILDSDLEISTNERPFVIQNEIDLKSIINREIKEIYSERKDEITKNSLISLLETPVYKRLWLGKQGVFGHSTATYEQKLNEKMKLWLLNRLESAKYWKEGELLSVARLADKLRNDSEFVLIAEMFRRRKDFDFTKLIEELVLPEAVPILSVLRYKDSGLEKRAIWERTWEAQRREDAIEKRVRAEYQQRVDASDGDQKIEYYEKYIREDIAREVGEIEVPPKYTNKDFRDQNFWRLRGKLDVSKERFVSFPYAERDADQSLVIGWAGWNHLELARAIASYYMNARQKEGWSNERLVPLLGAVIELIPWIRQWHDEYNLEYGGKPVEFFESFVEEEARSLGLSLNRIREWNPFQ
jgi:hypothetical protein